MTDVPERVIARVRSHARVLILPAVLLCAFAFGAVFLLGRVDWPLWDTVVLTSAALLVAALCVFPLLAWLSRRCVVTNRRVIVRSGFGGLRREVRLARIHDVSLRRRGLQVVFGSGDLLLSTGGERPIVIGDVPSAALMMRCLQEQIAAVPREEEA